MKNYEGHLYYYEKKIIKKISLKEIDRRLTVMYK